MSVYGPIVTRPHVERGVIGFLQRWLPSYLAELERQNNLDPGQLQPPRSWTTVNQLAQSREDDLPIVVLISPGLADIPERRGDGTYGGVFRIEVAVIVTASSQDAANDLAGYYTAAIRAALVQHPSLDGVAAGVDWAGEGWDDTPADYMPIGAIGSAAFDVHVDSLVDESGGTAQPDPPPDPQEPPADWPTVEIVELDAEARSIT